MEKSNCSRDTRDRNRCDDRSEFGTYGFGARNDVVERCFDFLNQAEIEFVQKDRLYELIRSERPAAGILSELFAMDISRDLRGVLVEILTAQIV